MEIFSIFSSWLLTAVLVLSMFLICRYTLKSNRSSMVSPKLPPNPPKLPIIGNLHQLLGKPRHLAFSQLSQEYGPVMLLNIGTRSCLIISSSAMAMQVLKDQDQILCSRPISKTTKLLTYNYVDAAFSPHSNHWRKMRKVLVSEFVGPKRARLTNHVLLTEVEIMLRSISLHPSNSAVNITELFLAIAKAMICKVAFGSNYRKREQLLKGPSLEVMLDEVMELLDPSLSDLFPWLGPIIDQISGRNHMLEKLFSNLDAYIQTYVDDHHNHIGKVDDDDKDFLHTLLELSSIENASHDDRFTIEEIKALIMDIFIGGIDTTFATMVWAMSEIIRSPRVMQKVQSEIRNCAGRKQKLDEMDVSKMTYLKIVVKETLRLHPPAALLLPHESLSHCQVGGYDVLPETMVFINGWVIGRDPSTWGENASEFYPERFENLDQVEFRGVNYDMVPFGGGRRTCPAIKTAPATIEFTIANLLYSYDWKIPGGEKNEDLNMLEEGSLLVRKKLPLFLVPTKHNWED